MGTGKERGGKYATFNSEHSANASISPYQEGINDMQTYINNVQKLRNKMDNGAEEQLRKETVDILRKYGLYNEFGDDRKMETTIQSHIAYQSDLVRWVTKNAPITIDPFYTKSGIQSEIRRLQDTIVSAKNAMKKAVGKTQIEMIRAGYDEDITKETIKKSQQRIKDLNNWLNKTSG